MPTIPLPKSCRHALVSAMLTCAAVTLAGCGAEVAGAAATAGSLSAASAKQAQAQQKQIVDQFKSLQDAGAARAASAAD